MKKFRLIKNYPGCVYKIGDYVEPTGKDFYQGEVNQPWVKKSSVENYPEFWEEVIEKDYEIISFKGTGSNLRILNTVNGLYYLDKIPNDYVPIDNLLETSKKSTGYKIHSVKRLSDGEV